MVVVPRYPRACKAVLSVSSAFSSAAGICSGDLPPAWARSGRPPPPPPTIGRDLLEPVAGVQAALDQVLRQAGDELDLSVDRRGQQDGQAGLALAPQDVDQLPHLVGRDVFDRLNHDGRPGDGLRRGEQVVGRDARAGLRRAAATPVS